MVGEGARSDEGTIAPRVVARRGRALAACVPDGGFAPLAPTGLNAITQAAAAPLLAWPVRLKNRAVHRDVPLLRESASSPRSGPSSERRWPRGHRPRRSAPHATACAPRSTTSSSTRPGAARACGPSSRWSRPSTMRPGAASRFFDILDHLMKDPPSGRWRSSSCIIVCLSLGFEGRLPGGRPRAGEAGGDPGFAVPRHPPPARRARGRPVATLGRRGRGTPETGPHRPAMGHRRGDGGDPAGRVLRLPMVPGCRAAARHGCRGPGPAAWPCRDRTPCPGRTAAPAQGRGGDGKLRHPADQVPGARDSRRAGHGGRGPAGRAGPDQRQRTVRLGQRCRDRRPHADPQAHRRGPEDGARPGRGRRPHRQPADPHPGASRPTGSCRWPGPESVHKILNDIVGNPGPLLGRGAKADTVPLASNDTADGRAQNRRIEVVLLKPTGGG